MRRLCALVLAGLLAAGCTTTTRTTTVATSPPPTTAADTEVTAIRLVSGEEVSFAEPAALGGDGSVAGRIEVAYTGSAEGRALRRVSYPAHEIAEYHLATEQRRLHVGKTVGLALGVAALGGLITVVVIVVNLRNS